MKSVYIFWALTLFILGGGGQIDPCDAKIREKCLYSHHNNAALIKKYPCFNSIQSEKKTLTDR